MLHLQYPLAAGPHLPVVRAVLVPDADLEAGPGPFSGPFVGGTINGLVGFSTGTGIAIAAALTPDVTTTILFAFAGAVTGTFVGVTFGAYAFSERMVHSNSIFMIEEAFV